jgi:hypothetical protein
MSNDGAQSAQAGQSSEHGIEPEVFGEKSRVGQWFPHDEDEIPDAASQLQASRMRLARLARNHGLVFLGAILAFAAADTWNVLSGLLIADLLCVTIAALAGITITTLVHEWFHYWGARFARAHVSIPIRQGLFVYVWDFGRNSTGQFLIMSIAGTIGSVFAVALLWTTVPADTLGRAVLRSAAVASVIYSAMIEWPVIRRSRYSGDPLRELSKIDKALLTRSFVVASVSGIAMTILLVY